MLNKSVEIFDKGIYNFVKDEVIPESGASDALGWNSTDDVIELARGAVEYGSDGGVSDVSQTKKDSITPVGQSTGSTNKTKIAQQFKPTQTRLNGISLFKETDTGVFSGTVTIDIQGDSSDIPDGISLVSKTYTNEEWLEIPVGFFDVEFSSSYDLDTTLKYWIVVSTSTQDSTKCINLRYSSTNEYTDGKLMSNNNTAWIDYTAGDLYFRTLTEPYGASTGIHIGYKVDGSKVVFRKAGSNIQYYNGTYWVDIISGLETAEIYAFDNYTSLAGNFTYIGGKSGLWKVVLANPEDVIDVYDEAKNFKGKIRIDRGAMFLWDRENDKTGLYRSKIDPQSGSVYTTVSAENLGALGSTEYNGTLDFKSGGAKRTCFGISITTTIDGETETVTDDFNGVLKGDKGATGTINYATGEYSIVFASATEAVVNADYQWEDSTLGGIADFTKSATRVAGEGFIMRQDAGGDKIRKLLIQDGNYYSMKERSVYKVTISDDDLTATNLPYRLNVGIPSYNGAVETSIGIVFMNTANPDKPQLTVLQKSTTGSELEPIILAPQFNLSNYEWDEMAMDTYGEYVVFSGKTKGSSSNNRLFLFNQRLNILDVVPFNVNNFAKDSGILYAGSSAGFSVHQILTGFDNDGSEMENYWIGRGELFETEDLKKYKYLQIKGRISREMKIEVYQSFDDDAFQLMGTILGKGAYVDQDNDFTIGSSGIGESAISGEYGVTAYGFLVRFKIKNIPKFRKIKTKFIAKGIGYASIERKTYLDLRLYEPRLPKKYRIKENVSLDGENTDQ